MSGSEEDSLASASLENLASVKLQDFHLPAVTIGRHPSCPIQCDWKDGPPDVCLMVSKRHATITVTPDAFSIKDEGSYNGLYVNWQRLPQHVERILSSGDIVCLGPRYFYSVTNATNRLSNPFVFQFRHSAEETGGIPVLVCDRLLNTPGSVGPRIHLHWPVRPPFSPMESGDGSIVRLEASAPQQSVPYGMPLAATTPQGAMMVSGPSTTPAQYNGWPGGPELMPRVRQLGEGSSEGPRFTPAPPQTPAPPSSEGFVSVGSLLDMGRTTVMPSSNTTPHGARIWGIGEASGGHMSDRVETAVVGFPEANVAGGEAVPDAGQAGLPDDHLAQGDFSNPHTPAMHVPGEAALTNVEGGSDDHGTVLMGKKREREEAVTNGKRPRADNGAGPSSPKCSDEEQKDLDGTPRSLKWMKDEMMCPVCYNWLLYSHTLACSHTFCGDCIFQWLEAGQGAKTCPVCRVKVTVAPVHLRVLDALVEEAHKTDPEAFHGRESRRAAFAATMKERAAALEARFKRQDMQDRARGAPIMAPTGHGPRLIPNAFLITNAGRLTRLVPEQIFPRRQRNYVIDVARNNETQCTICLQRICDKKLRVAPVEDMDRGQRRPHWYHFGCLVQRNELRLDTLQGIDQLPPLLQNRVVAMIQQQYTRHSRGGQGQRQTQTQTVQPPVLPLPRV